MYSTKIDNKIDKGGYLEILLRSEKTVFSTKDIALLWGETNMEAARVRLHYYVKNGKLLHLRKGLYAKDADYNRYEAAVGILKPSYISFETILGANGITFQYYPQIFVASYLKRDILCNDQRYSYRRIKKEILINPAGIDQSGIYSVATKERAFLDTIYRSKDYYFDNLSPLDWEKVFEILPIYESGVMEKRVKKYYQSIQ